MVNEVTDIGYFKFIDHDILGNSLNDISKYVTANWSCLWLLEDHLIDFYEYDSRCKKYPGVLVLANVSEI